MRIVVDTNVIVSATMSPNGAPNALVRAWMGGAVELLVTTSIIAEYEEILTRPEISRFIRMSKSDVAELTSAFHRAGRIAEEFPVREVIFDDPDDEIFLTCAVNGDADYLASGDAHLLELRAYRGIPSVPPAVFLALLDTGET